MPCAPRTWPEPTATGETTTSVCAEVDEAGAGADDVGDRVEGADLVEVDVGGVVAVGAGLGAGEPLEDAQRQARDAARRGRRLRSASMSRQVRWCTESATSTWQRVAASPLRVTCSTRSLTGSGAIASTARCSTSTGTPAPTRAPSSMSPLAPAEASTQIVMVLAPDPSGDPRGEDARAVPVVDVDHGHARRAGVEHRQQRGQAAERRAVPDAGRDRHHGHADQAADDRRAARPPCRPPRPGSRPARARRVRRAGGAARRRRRR